MCSTPHCRQPRTDRACAVAYKASGGKRSVLDSHAPLPSGRTEDHNSPPSPSTSPSPLLIAVGTVGLGGVFLTMVETCLDPSSCLRNDIKIGLEGKEIASERAMAQRATVSGLMVDMYRGEQTTDSRGMDGSECWVNTQKKRIRHRFRHRPLGNSRFGSHAGITGAQSFTGIPDIVHHRRAAHACA